MTELVEGSVIIVPASFTTAFPREGLTLEMGQNRWLGMIRLASS